MSELIKTGRRLFHTGDLMLLWGISRPATLHMRLSRYFQKGILYPIHRGLYSVVPLEKLDPREVAVSINHGFCYLTMETILSRYGVINRMVKELPFVGLRSKTILWKDQRFIFRQLKNPFLFHPAGVNKEGDFMVASLERAVADTLYFYPKFYFDSQALINWNKVEKIRKEVGYVG